MKAHLDIRHDGNLSSEGRVTMSFDENSIAHLMSILTDLYSDPELAVIREYSTNAWDSHRAAGNDDPIEVYLPSALNPIFVVRDRGVGMDLDAIYNFFAKYGASTKRDTDDEVGMLGLGCKSALTYTSQFTLVAVKGGVKATVLITREASGAGAVQVMDTQATDEPNGVEVRIPIKHVDTFNRRARDFYYYWDSGTVLIDEVPVRTIWDDPRRDLIALDPDVIVRPGRQSMIVMGNVAYPTKSRMVDSDSSSVVVRVPIGSVNFTPSREALQYTKRTEEVVETITEFVEESILARAQADMNAQPTYFDALKRALEWRRAHRGMHTLEYRGRTVPTSFNLQQPIYSWNSRSYYDDKAVKTHYIGVEDAIGQWHVVGYSQPYVTSLTKERVKKLMEWYNATTPVEERRQAVTFHFHRDDDFGDPWLRGQGNFITWAELQTVEVPQEVKERTYRRPKGKYRLLSGSSKNYDWATEVPEGAVWALQEQVDYRRENVARHVATVVGPTCRVVAVPRKDARKFQKDHPDVPHISAAVARAGRAWVEALTPLQRYMLEEDDTLNDCGIDKIGRGHLLDPELVWLRDLHRSTRGRADVVDHWRTIQRAFAAWNLRLPKVVATSYKARILAAVRPYPLLVGASYYNYGRRGGGLPDSGVVFIQYVNDTYRVREQMHLHPLTY